MYSLHCQTLVNLKECSSMRITDRWLDCLLFPKKLWEGMEEIICFFPTNQNTLYLKLMCANWKMVTLKTKNTMEFDKQNVHLAWTLPLHVFFSFVCTITNWKNWTVSLGEELLPLTNINFLSHASVAESEACPGISEDFLASF